ncbi:MAG TPA: NAD(P)-dependent oxidoreductase [Burkholderiales bacterium]|nr:NAD(P)-dependent oxidoreductase [Burkholderiales bacterium]
MSLKEKTIFITGASRGIGRSIALRCAQDGANIVIAAKTAEPHPKLSGTIHTVAREVEQAGGRALPLQLDIREEEAVFAAVKQAVGAFGGIDILVNNASAISLTGTLATPIKRYDLMQAINARGTYLCSQVCLPHLLKAANPHILTLSPPLNLNPRWFAAHAAYTISKYGMSMCTLGMAAEFKERGVAVNSLWPRTTIATAAVEVFFPEALASSRKPEIMGDAAYLILTRDSRSATGNFYLDDEVLRAAGVTDLGRYAVTPGVPASPDIFLD